MAPATNSIIVSALQQLQILELWKRISSAPVTLDNGCGEIGFFRKSELLLMKI
jgi:hypothetical protein